MKRRDFLKVVGGVAAVTAVGAVAAKPRAAKARVCERNVGTLRAIYPVGAIYISTTNVNPADLFGFGTWQRFGDGRTLVGVQTGDAEFGAVQATGGARTHTMTEAEMPAHNHTQAEHTHNDHVGNIDQTWHASHMRGAGGVFSLGTHDLSGNRAAFETGSFDRIRWNMNASHNTVTPTINNRGGGGAHNNLQPYITVFMWRRSA